MLPPVLAMKNLEFTPNTTPKSYICSHFNETWDLKSVSHQLKHTEGFESPCNGLAVPLHWY
jgi:hypothetical protein